jgi:hypothetical protein
MTETFSAFPLIEQKRHPIKNLKMRGLCSVVAAWY